MGAMFPNNGRAGLEIIKKEAEKQCAWTAKGSIFPGAATKMSTMSHQCSREGRILPFILKLSLSLSQNISTLWTVVQLLFEIVFLYIPVEPQHLLHILHRPRVPSVRLYSDVDYFAYF